MKICVLGKGLLSEDFKRLNFVVIEDDIYDFDTDQLADYDTIINTHEYRLENNQEDIKRLIRVNVNFSSFISDYCERENKHYVYLSTGELYDTSTKEFDENSRISADNAYQSSKFLAEKECNKGDLIIRTKNIFNDQPSMDNALYKAIKNSKPTMNLESYTWTVDLIRSIVILLRKKKHGVFNVTSDGLMSQSRICNIMGVENIAPCEDKRIDKYHTLDCSSLHKLFTPMSLLYNIKKCYGIINGDLELK